MELAAPGILKRVLKSEEEGADAIIIWGGHDSSLRSARELVSIPVLGPGMASMYLASALAEKFCLLVQLPEVKNNAYRQVRDLGLGEKCAGIYSIGLPVLELRKLKYFDKIKKTAINSIEKSGADAVCLGCMALNDHAQQLSRSLAESHPSIIVINPGEAVVKLAELIVEMNLSHSKRSYTKPPKKVIL